MGKNSAFTGGGSISSQKTNVTSDIKDDKNKKPSSPFITNPDGSTQTPGGTPLSPAPTNTKGGSADSTEQDVNKVVDTQKEIDTKLIDAQKKALEDNTKKQENLEAGVDFNTQQEENKKYAEDAKNRTETFYDENEKLVNKSSEDIAKIEAEQTASYQARIDRDAVLLRDKADSQNDLLKAEAEMQRVTNRDAIRQARVDVDILRQQSAWGYNKIGLGFSSGIINQSQQIATNGIIKIAELKAKMSFQEATITTKIADVEYNYSNLVNQSIDKYTDKIDGIKKDAIKRGNDVEKSLLLNNFNRKTQLDKLAKDTRDEKRQAEQDHLDDIEKVKDKGIEYMKDIQDSVDNYNRKEQSKLNESLADGTIINMLPGEMADKEAELGLAPGTINNKINKNINGRIRTKFDELAGEGEMIGDISSLNKEVRAEMENGRDYDTALNVVMEREINTNPELKTAIEAKKFKDGAKGRLDERKVKATEDRLKETVRSNKAREAISAGQLAVSRAQANAKKNGEKEINKIDSSLIYHGETKADIANMTEKEKEDAEDRGIKKSIKNGTLRGDDFDKVYASEMTTLLKDDSSESNQEKAMQGIIDSLYDNGANTGTVKAYLIENGVLQKGDEGLAEGKYYIEDNEILRVEDFGLDDDVLTFKVEK